MHFLNLTLGIRLKEMVLYYSMKMVRSNENKNNIIYSNSMKTNRNELIRRLLSGVTDDELENLVRVREEARRPIPAPRKMGVKQLIRLFEKNNLYKPPRPAPPKSNHTKIKYWDEIYPDDKIYIRPEDGKKFSIVDGVCHAVHPIYKLYAASEDGIIINVKHGSPISYRQHPETYSMHRNVGCSKRLQRQVRRFVYECHNGILPKGKLITHINGNKKDNRLCNLQINTRKFGWEIKQDKLDMLYDN